MLRTLFTRSSSVPGTRGLRQPYKWSFPSGPHRAFDVDRADFKGSAKARYLGEEKVKLAEGEIKVHGDHGRELGDKAPIDQLH
jgi:hypothetical protein